VDVAAFGMGYDAAAAHVLDLLPIGLRGQVVGDVEALEFGDIVIAGHGVSPLNCAEGNGRIGP
jgi:hypothetical protein